MKHANPNARSIGEIIDAVEAEFVLPQGAISDMRRRTREVSLARHVAYYIARRETRLSFAAIAREMRALDHKAVLYGFNRVSIALTAGGRAADDAIYLTIRKIAPELVP